MSSKATAIAVFDISSSSVGGAHALIGKNKSGSANVTILVQERRDTGLEEELDIDRFVNDTARALEAVVTHVRAADVHHPEYIQVVLASPWYGTHVRTISYSRENAFTCTQRLIDSLVEKEIAYFLKQPADNGEAFGKGFKVVEQQLSNISLNGYETNDPFGKKVHSMELLLTVTIVPEPVVERFSGILRRSYGDRPINVTTGPYATYVALRDNGGMPDDSVILDIGEEITDLALIKNGLFLYQHSFPVGTYELYRAVSQATGSTIEARALIEAYRLKKLTPTKTRMVEKALHAFAALWQKSLQQVIEEGNYGFLLPSACYVTADIRFRDLFTGIIRNDRFIQHAASVEELTVVFVDTVQTNASVSVVSMDQPDIPLAIGALFTERLL